MTPFTIVSNPPLLTRDIQAFYHTNFYGATHPENPNYLYKLKNDPHHNWSIDDLKTAMMDLAKVIIADLPKIQTQLAKASLTICVVPRAKAENTYHSNQLLFKSTIKQVVNKLGLLDGTSYLVRHTNTKTTHLRLPIAGFNNEGSVPYIGITNETCHISNNVQGKDILLIDDIYTKTIDIDEDAIQALISKGANSVAFYAIGNTVLKY